MPVIDPLLLAEDVVRVLGEHGRSITVGTWRGYVSRQQAPQPLPKDTILVGGRWRPRWRRSVVLAWHDRRESGMLRNSPKE